MYHLKCDWDSVLPFFFLLLLLPLSIPLSILFLLLCRLFVILFFLFYFSSVQFSLCFVFYINVRAYTTLAVDI